LPTIVVVLNQEYGLDLLSYFEREGERLAYGLNIVGVRTHGQFRLHAGANLLASEVKVEPNVKFHTSVCAKMATGPVPDWLAFREIFPYFGHNPR
jgi:hypothetical protein